MTHLQQFLEFALYGQGFIRQEDPLVGGYSSIHDTMIAYQERWAIESSMLYMASQRFMIHLNEFFNMNVVITPEEWASLRDNEKELVVSLDKRVHAVLMQNIPYYEETIQSLLYEMPDCYDIRNIVSLLPDLLQRALTSKSKAERQILSEEFKQQGYPDAAHALCCATNSAGPDDIYIMIYDKIDGLFPQELKKLSLFGGYLESIKKSYELNM